MIDFDDLLQRMFPVLNQGFERAKQEAEDVLDRLNASLAANVGAHVVLHFIEIYTGAKYSIYGVFLDPDSSDATEELVPVIHMRIPAAGYPIELGSIDPISENFASADRVLNDVDAIEVFFADELSNPDSAFVYAIGFALRMKASAG
ncbi:MAG TPA: hypothetical protein VL424_10725 [Pararobbsia sp.]|nr:hypothetical protein [Pararobbsia sp.]